MINDVMCGPTLDIIDKEPIKTTRRLGFLYGPSPQEIASHYILKARRFLEHPSYTEKLDKVKDCLDEAKKQNVTDLLKELHDEYANLFSKKVFVITKGQFSKEKYDEAEFEIDNAMRYGFSNPTLLLDQVKKWARDHYIEKIETIINQDYSQVGSREGSKFIRKIRNLGMDVSDIETRFKRWKTHENITKINEYTFEPYSPEKEKMFDEGIRQANYIRNREPDEANQQVRILRQWKANYYIKECDRLFNNIREFEGNDIGDLVRDVMSHIHEVDKLSLSPQVESLRRKRYVAESQYFTKRVKKLLSEMQTDKKLHNIEGIQEKHQIIDQCFDKLMRIEQQKQHVGVNVDLVSTLSIELGNFHLKYAKELNELSWFWNRGAKNEAELAISTYRRGRESANQKISVAAAEKLLAEIEARKLSSKLMNAYNWIYGIVVTASGGTVWYIKNNPEQVSCILDLVLTGKIYNPPLFLNCFSNNTISK